MAENIPTKEAERLKFYGLPNKTKVSEALKTAALNASQNAIYIKIR